MNFYILLLQIKFAYKIASINKNGCMDSITSSLFIRTIIIADCCVKKNLFSHIHVISREHINSIER